VHLKGADSMAIFGLRFGNTLVGSGWAKFCSVHKCAEETVFILHGTQLPAQSHDYCKLTNG